MEYPVSITGSVMPICLPTFNSVFIHPMGTVVGWGKSETSTVREPHESIPKQINVRAVTNEKCFLEYAEFAKISSYRTFCAGWPGMNVGPCHGEIYFRPKVLVLRRFSPQVIPAEGCISKFTTPGTSKESCHQPL